MFHNTNIEIFPITKSNWQFKSKITEKLDFNKV